MNERGILIAIEGGDGSGKATQAEMLKKHYSEVLGKHVMKISFPRYGQPSAYFVEQYLSGKYGDSDNAPTELASLAFALDRFAAKNEITEALKGPDDIVISDRYVASSLAHMGAKFTDTKERREFYDRLMSVEYGILGAPRPNKNIVLLVPTKTAQTNINHRDIITNNSNKQDIHEASKSHLDRAQANYKELCELYPDDFTSVQCTDESGKMRTIDDIQQEIQTIIAIDVNLDNR